MRKIQNAELARLTPEDFKKADKNPFVIVLDNVRSMNNIGSIFRTADAFRCTSVFLCGITATPPHREIHKTALGAEDAVEWFYEKDVTTAVIRLKNEGYLITGIEQVQGGVSLENFIPAEEKKYAFIFGHEINGISNEVVDLCDLFIEIPQQGTKHSLNVSVAAGILSWHYIFVRAGKTDENSH